MKTIKLTTVFICMFCIIAGLCAYSNQTETETDNIINEGVDTPVEVTSYHEYNSAAIDQPYILFLEDVGSDLLNVHAALTLLKNTGVLENASGIILGEWTDFRIGGSDYDGNSRGGIFTSADDMIYRQFLKDLDVPVAFDFPAGHGENNYPLLMGEKLRLTVSEDSYTLEWLDVE